MRTEALIAHCRFHLYRLHFQVGYKNMFIQLRNQNLRWLEDFQVGSKEELLTLCLVKIKISGLGLFSVVTWPPSKKTPL